ncbi:MAG TPA: hypothetical protein VGO50_04610 [Pyrinomonadaceae bacterium]|nr:hypothetical protein [Pyrinomonadaceae bacterium]
MTTFFLLALGLQLLFLHTEAKAQPFVLETIKADLVGCVKYDHEKPGYVFEDLDALKAAFYPAGEYNKICRKEAGRIDFAKYSLLGVDIRNAQCHEFLLEHKVIKDDAAMLYRFRITHPHHYSPCAGITTHGLWVLVPKLPSGYRATFEISERMTPEEEEYGKEVRVFNIDGMASSPARCLRIDNRVYNEESLKTLLSFDECRKISAADKVDLKNQTLIGWQARGDCRMLVETCLYRDDKKKLFTFLIKNRWGGCRAAGWHEGLLTIPKIPADYNVNFVEYQMSLNSESFSDDFDKHRAWSADGQELSPRPNISFASPEESTPPAAPTASGRVAAAPADGVVGAPTPRPDETEVKILRNADSRFYPCRGDIGGVYTEAEYQALLANKECAGPRQLKADLKKESVIGFSASGDCHVSARAKVFRNDTAKTYTIRVNKIYGGCRAYGQYRGWIMIGKMLTGYQVKWEHTKTDESGVTEREDPASYLHPQTQETTEIELDGCIQLYRQNQFVIKDNDSFLKAIRGDADNDRCVKKLKGKIDFSKYSLVGIDINSGYCGLPIGLTHKAVRDDAKKTVTMQISYIAPQGTCRAMSSYDLWVTVPKIPDGYEVKFETGPIPGTDRHDQ